MARASFSFPKQWEDWSSWVLGIWLLLSPWALFFEYETAAVQNALVVGALIILLALVELSVFHDWEEWINVIIGAWLVISPWALGITKIAAKANFMIVGVLVLALALYELWEMRADSARSKSEPRP